MQRMINVLIVNLSLLLLAQCVYAEEDLEQTIVQQQKLADEAQAQKAAGEPAVIAARTKAKELAASLAALRNRTE